MKLHDAIAEVLSEAGRPLSSREIADRVNQRSLYERADGTALGASQVSARVGHHPEGFVRADELYSLADDDQQREDEMTSGAVALGGGWDELLREELNQPYWRALMHFVAAEREAAEVYPSAEQVFRAFELTPFDQVKVVILGQDPYPNRGQADGLAFSVPKEWEGRLPPSLMNIRKLLLADQGADAIQLPRHGSLETWATQGVLLLNTALTVRAGSKSDRATHRRVRFDGKGWTTFTDAVIRAFNGKEEPVVILLWGKDARRKKVLIDGDQHTVLESVHPSSISAWRGFLDPGHRPFSRANEILAGRAIDWSSPSR